MLTSFVQYLLLLPSYVNILLIYAFCNLHDVSWGTKGDNGASKDLGAAKKVEKDGKEMAEVALPTKEEDVEALWQQARSELRVPAKEVKEKRSPETKRSDGELISEYELHLHISTFELALTSSPCNCRVHMLTGSQRTGLSERTLFFCSSESTCSSFCSSHLRFSQTGSRPTSHLPRRQHSIRIW